MVLNPCLTLLVVYIIGDSLTVTSTCPYDVPACTCSDDTINCYRLQTLPQLKSDNNDSSFVRIFFYQGNLISIPRNSLPRNLLLVSFEDQPISDISDDAFLASATTLGTLSFSNAKFRRLPAALLKIAHLEWFELTNTHIEYWDNAILEHIAKSVMYLSLVNVGLSTFPDWSYLFHSLGGIALSDNFLGSIPDDAFLTSKYSLSDLRLRNTGLIHVPKALSVMKKIMLLDLSGNNITGKDGRPGIEQITSFAFASTVQLLMLESIGLTEIPNISNMTGLLGIYLSNNEITEISINSLPPSVSTLDIKGNKLNAIPATISKLSKLSYFFLSNNEISEINFEALPASLVQLYLSSNKIAKITGPAISNLSNLRTLLLDGNPITTISPSAFKNIPQLGYLTLGGANFTEIPLAVTTLTKLWGISLTNTPSSLTCSCPPAPELIQWYLSYKGTLKNLGYCSDGKVIDDYLSHTC